jgi:transposase
MRKVLEVLRLLFDQDRSQREIATILALSQGTVHNYVARFRAAGLPWPLRATARAARRRCLSPNHKCHGEVRRNVVPHDNRPTEYSLQFNWPNITIL